MIKDLELLQVASADVLAIYKMYAQLGQTRFIKEGGDDNEFRRWRDVTTEFEKRKKEHWETLAQRHSQYGEKIRDFAACIEWAAGGIRSDSVLPRLIAKIAFGTLSPRTSRSLAEDLVAQRINANYWSDGIEETSRYKLVFQESGQLRHELGYRHPNPLIPERKYIHPQMMVRDILLGTIPLRGKFINRPNLYRP